MSGESYEAAITNELTRSPDDPEILLRAGSYYFEPGRNPDKAVELLRKALTLDPRNTRVRFWLAKCLYHDFCDYVEAEQLIRDSLELNPNQPDALSLLASILGDLDRPVGERVAVLYRSVELAPDWPLPRLFLAHLLLDGGRTGEAKRVLSEWAITERAYHPVAVTNPTAEYYEEAVTGRNSPECYAELKSLSTKHMI